MHVSANQNAPSSIRKLHLWESDSISIIHFITTMASLRTLIPRGSFALHSKQLQSRLVISGLRNASSQPPKPRLLEKPERFNPPSHPSRIRAKPKYYGAPLSEHERQAQKERRYPHMMPPKGTFMFWFLTDRSLHLYITMVCHSNHIFIHGP